MIGGRGRPVGRYLPGSSAWHRADPRTKLAVVAATAVALARPDLSPPVLLAVAAAPLLIGLAGGLRARDILAPIPPLALLLAATVMASVLLVPGRPILEGVPGSIEGLLRGVGSAGRLAGMLLAAQLMVLTTPALLLARGIETVTGRVPMLRKGTASFPIVFSLTLRFVPLLLDEWAKLRESAATRGYLGGGTGPLRRLGREAGLLVPLFLVSFRRAEEMALSMHLRGYRTGAARTALHPLSLSRGDAAVMLLAGAACLLAWIP